MWNRRCVFVHFFIQFSYLLVQESVKVAVVIHVMDYVLELQGNDRCSIFNK